LNGRRTVWDDPYKPGRNGLVGLEQRIESQSPLALVILMLGTNDFQSTHVCDASDSARGTAALVGAIRGAPVEPGMPIPRILVVVPPSVRDPRGPIAAKFRGAEAKCVGLGTALRSTAAELSCAFFDAETVTTTSRVDGVHLDEDQHATLGRALVDVVLPLVADEA
jgi:lysophospholipase L1-like esterase